MAKRIKKQGFDPGKYCIVRCPECNGKGKFPDQDKGLLICSLCGGVGFIKKENNVSDQNLNPNQS